MATSTTNLGLIKPSGSDKIRIAQINQNMDTIDEKIGPVGSTSLQAQLNTANQALAKYGNIAGTRITSGSDLNNVTTAGNYYVDTASDAANIGNMPTNIGGRLEVTEINGSSRLRQIFFTNSSRPDVYVRSYISTGWTVWEKLAYAGDVENLTNVKFAAISNDTVNLTVSNSLRAMMLVAGNSNGVRGIVNLASSGAGAPNATNVGGDTSALTFNHTTNNISITFASPAQCLIFILNGSVSVN